MDIRKRMKTYETLVNIHAVSGHEKPVRNFMKAELSQYTDEIVQDKLGGIFGISRGNDGPTIMIAGHMDEVGAMVTGITKEGFITMIPIGGINPEVMVSQNMLLHTDDGTEIPGVVGAIPPHITKADAPATITFDSLLLDVGADSKKHAEDMGIQIGQQITFVNHYYVTQDGKKIVSKAWDDRFGCGMALEILKEAQKSEHPNTIIAGANVQEEIGTRGAYVSSDMIKPDLFIAIDVSPVGDFLHKDHPRAYGKLGEGFLIRFYDPRNLMNPEIKDYFEKLARKKSIKMQQFLSLGGTDAAAAQYAGRGTLSVTIGLPGRYIHSSATMIHIDDVEAVKKMVMAIIRDFDEKRLQELAK